RSSCLLSLSLFFFNDPAPTEIYTLSLHDALPILGRREGDVQPVEVPQWLSTGLLGLREHGLADLEEPQHGELRALLARELFAARSEEHTSELQSLAYLVCRLLLEKKK